MIGRDDELGRLRDALERLPDGARAVVVAGEPGIGKTILWEAALADAASSGYRVLRASGAQSEVQLLLGALGDLLQAVHEIVLPPLPSPQRLALAVALLLEESEEQPDLRALAVAFLSALRELAASEPVFVSDENNNRVQEFSSSGQFVNTWGSGGDTAGLFTNPLGLDGDVAGNVYVADEGNARIQKFYLGANACLKVNRTHLAACNEAKSVCMKALAPSAELSCVTKTTARFKRYRTK